MTLEQIYNTQAYIEQHYHETIAVSRLESISHYSYRNLQRVFKSVYGETIGAYQSRLKVENAYKKLLFTQATISDIALEVGYADLQALRKAFVKRFGFPPSQARAEKQALFTVEPMVAHLTTSLTPSFEHLPAVKVYYQSVKTDYDKLQIDQLWDRLMNQPIPGKGCEYYGLINDEPLITEGTVCRYDACISGIDQLDEIPQKSILGGRYAKFVHEGSYDLIDATYDRIFGGWLFTNQYRGF